MTQELPKIASPVPFKRFTEPVLGKMLQPGKIGPDDKLVPYLKAGHVQWSGIEIPEDLPLMWASPSEVAGLQPSKGDLLVCEGGEVGRATLVQETLPEETIIQNSLHLVREGALAYPPYLKYAIEHIAASGWLDLVCNKATIAHLTVDKLRTLPIPYWTRPDQTRIANFLDEKTARIDALIAEKERLVKAVGDLFKARLGTAVVEGLDGQCALVSAHDKGFDKVRKDWRLVPLKYLVSFGGGMTPSKDNEEFWSGDVPWVSPKDMKRFILDNSEDHVSEAALEATGLKLHPIDSVLVVVRGMILAHTFPVATNAAPVTINQDMKALRANSEISPKYLAWLLRGLQPLMLSLTEESAHGTKVLRTDKWANQSVPVPSRPEQDVLVAVYELWGQDTARLSSHLREHISLLREYRSSLISAAVTGQLNIDDVKVGQLEAA